MQLNNEAGLADLGGNTIYRDYKHPEGGGYGDIFHTFYQQLHTDPRKPLPSRTASPQEDFANARAHTLVLDMTVSKSNKTHSLRTSLSPYNVMLHTNF